MLFANYPIKTPQMLSHKQTQTPSGWMSQRQHLGRTPGRDEAVCTITIVKELHHGGK